MLRRFLILFATGFLFAAPAIAERYESKTLFRKGAWFVEITHDTEDGSLWCSASSNNRRGQSFTLTAYESDALVMFVFDKNWAIAPRKVRFLVDIDYSRWTIDGNADGISASIHLDDTQKSVKFLKELQLGSAVAVLNNEERRLAVFSLKGSSAAISKLFDCWNSIGARDPFGTRGIDPFGASSDPFN